MADKWAQYAEPAASAAPAVTAAPATPPPPAADKWAQYAETPAPAAAKEQPGFFESAWNAINPAPAVREWLNRPQAHRDAADAMVVGMRLHKEKRDPTPAEQEIIDRGMKAGLQHPEGNLLAEMSGPGFTAAGQVKDGNLSGAAGTLVGGYGVPAALGAAAPALGEGAAKAGTFTGAAVKAAAPQVAGGAALMGVGEAIAKGAQAVGLPDVAWPVRVGMSYPGTKMITTGLKKGFAAGKVALADRLAAITEKSAAAEKATAEAAAQAAPKRLPAAPDASFVRSVPAEAPPPPTPKGLLGPSRTLITPAPEDASFVRSVPAEYPQVEGGRAPAAAAPVPPAALPMDLLDGIAKGQAGGKPFAKLAPEDQEAVRAIARRIQDPTPLTEQPAQPLPARRAPDQVSQPGNMVPSVSAEAPQPTVRPPAPAAIQGPAAPVQAEVQQPIPIAQQLADEMHASGTSSSEPFWSKELSALRGEEMKQFNRATKAARFAEVMKLSNTAAPDMAHDAGWNKIAKDAGEKIPSPETRAAINGLLDKPATQGATALRAAVEKNGATVAASKAKLKPQQQ